MTELMKRYEKETGKSPLLPIRCGNCTSDYITWLETKVEDEKRHYQQLDEMYIVVSRAEVNQRKEAEKLKAQLTWRPVSEAPEENEYYLCRMKGDVEAVCQFWYGEWYDFEGPYREWRESDRITHWLPIPPAPEGE